MQVMQALCYNFCNIFITQHLPATYIQIYENEIRTGTKSSGLSFSASVPWFYITIFLWTFRSSFKGLAESKMNAWLITAFTTYEVAPISLRVLLQGLFFFLSLYSICQNESANWMKSVKKQIIISGSCRTTYS